MDKELLYRFFNGETSVEEEQRLLDEIDRDPANRRELLAERRLFDSVLMLAPSERAARRKPRVFALGRMRSVFKYAAVLVVALGVGAFGMRFHYDRMARSGNTVSVPAGQRVDLVLPDGTKVWMNACSELEYPALFSRGERRVRLDGEAFFDVAHDKAHPFIVETFACDVEVLGTKFDVEAHAESGKFVTSLVEGCVRVLDRDSHVDLRPGEQVSQVDGRLVVGRIPDYENFQCRDGLIAFRDASFGELIEEFEKYYGVRIVVTGDRDFSGNRFTGKIRISEGVDHALWVLQRSADFVYERNESRDVIYIR